MLHFQRKDFAVEDGFRGAGTRDHEFPCVETVEFGDCSEEVEEVAAVGGIEFGYEAGVEKEELRAVAEGGEGAEGCEPWGGRVGEEVGGFGGGVGGGGCGEEGEGRWGGFEEADHDVAWVEIGVNEVVDDEHVLRGGRELC